MKRNMLGSQFIIPIEDQKDRTSAPGRLIQLAASPKVILMLTQKTPLSGAHWDDWQLLLL